jgi:hypothetical protein
MIFEKKAPPVEKKRGFSGQFRDYSTLMSEVRANAGQWIAVPLTEITGRSRKTKQNVILQAARGRKMFVQTSIQEDMLYVRSIAETPAEVANA